MLGPWMAFLPGMLGILSFRSSQAWTPTHHDGFSKAAQLEL